MVQPSPPLPVLRRRPAGRTRGCLLRSTPETSRRLRSQIRESPDSPGRFTPRGDGNSGSRSATTAPCQSSDPKPREGTETFSTTIIRRLSSACRQTQNPERGRKPHGPGRAADGPGGRQTQNPERGRKLHHASCHQSASSSSSDPKPREGTETCIRKVRTLETLPTCRQTQNPERGRKLNNTFFERGAVESVVRPKTPRGDGNMCAVAVSAPRPVSSDPKPREGTETRKRSTSLTILFSRRQT
ncbi:hypothetical protein P486_02895 [Mycobacterium tuberculosis TKK_04_0003]|nr:hypothetical protein P486_02895 [Mycobacterium tuberculosis TKK_04_0003]